MLILALDSTALAASVALCRDETPLAAFTLQNGNTHSQTLLPMVSSALKIAGYTISDVGLFACSKGPGSFTGVRIGAATVKGLAFGSGKPVIGVSTLEALAENLMPARGLFCPVMNARRGQVYNALFRSDGQTLVRLCPDRAVSLPELEKELADLGEPYFLCGDGSALAAGALRLHTPENTPELLLPQNAVSVARCALRAYRAGIRTTEEELAPAYLRLPQAERERLEKEKAKREGTKP